MRGRTHCPDCYSEWIGYPVPAGSVLVEDHDKYGIVTLANGETGRFIESVDRSHARCLDCGTSFNGEDA